jgi:hypothetical protein
MVMKLTMVNQEKLEYGQPWFVGRPWSQGGKSMVQWWNTYPTMVEPWLSMVSDGNHGQPWLHFDRGNNGQ